MRWRQVVLLAALVVSICTATVAQLLPKSEPEPSPTAKEIQSSFDSFCPKVDLACARFVIAQSGTFLVELSNDQSFVSAEHPTLQKTLLNEKRMDRFLPKATQNHLFTQIPESRGDSFTVYYPSSASFQQRSLRGLTPRFVGAGTLDGLWGILGKANGKVDDWEIVGLAFPGRFAAKGMSSTPTSSGSLSEADNTGILETLTKVAHTTDLTLVFAKKVQVDYGRNPGAAVVVRKNNGDQNLLCLYKKANDWEVIPFGPRQEDLEYAIPADGGGVAFLQPNAEMGYAFTHSNLSILPDMDGDGNGELMLNSDAITILFAVRQDKNTCFVKEIRGISFAS